MKKILAAIMLLFIAAPLAGCSIDVPQNAEKVQREKTAKLQADAEARIGMPRVTNFTEKRLANMILELRDQPNLATYTYRTDMNGGAHCIGRSIGFGLPYTTQVTSPDKPYGGTYGYTTVNQAEPNGLYSSDSTNATWVLLVGKDGKPKPAYIEDDVTITLEPLPTAIDQC